MFSSYTQATCTILFQTRANQLVCSSVFLHAYLYLELKEMQIGIFQIKKCIFTTAFAKVGILVD